MQKDDYTSGRSKYCESTYNRMIRVGLGDVGQLFFFLFFTVSIVTG